MHERPAGPTTGGGVDAQSSGPRHPPLQAAYDFELAYDAADGYVVLLGAEEGGYGSAGSGDMWKFQGGVWWQLFPDPMPQNCPGSALAYDDRDGYLVYFGGPDQGRPSIACSSGNQTWTYLAGVWTLLHPSSFPSPRYGAALTNDSADGGLILFGGMSLGGALNGETWAFSSGTWSQVHPTTAPSARSEAGLAYDEVDGYVLLFGGMDGGYPGLNDSWTYTGGQWTQLHPTVSPPYPEPDALSYVASDGVVLFTGAWNSSAGLPEVTWTFHAGTWSEVTSARPTERIADQTVHDYSDGYTIMFGGSGYADTWSFAAGAWTDITDLVPTLVVPSFSINPSIVVVGNRTTFTVAASGGIPPYGYAFSGLPLGCADANASVLDCTPTTWGFFPVTVTVTDWAGQATLATAQLEVLPPALRISLFGADPSTTAPGSLVTLSMALSGGAPPYTFAYQGLPQGCVSQNSSSLTCRPAENGSFEITVKVA
ncbi:MAG TPA: kelch repeat-containing protein, partial [Thermoplasmata archaeon]